MPSAKLQSKDRARHAHSDEEVLAIHYWGLSLGRDPNLAFEPVIMVGHYHRPSLETWEKYSHPLHTTTSHETSEASAVSLRERLDNANNHFRRKAAEVLGDEATVAILAQMYEQSTIQLAKLDSGKDGICLAKLAAANFCEISANLVYITEAGQNFIESLTKNDTTV